MAVLTVSTSSAESFPKCAVPIPNPMPGTVLPSERRTGAKVDMADGTISYCLIFVQRLSCYAHCMESEAGTLTARVGLRSACRRAAANGERRAQSHLRAG